MTGQAQRSPKQITASQSNQRHPGLQADIDRSQDLKESSINPPSCSGEDGGRKELKPRGETHTHTHNAQDVGIQLQQADTFPERDSHKAIGPKSSENIKSDRFIS